MSIEVNNYIKELIKKYLKTRKQWVKLAEAKWEDPTDETEIIAEALSFAKLYFEDDIEKIKEADQH